MATPSTTARLSHALTLRCRGRTLGAIHQWSPSMARIVDTEFEVNVNGHGLPADQVGQTVERREVRVSRYDLYRSVMEDVFGTTELQTLADQSAGFSVRERWTGPGFNVAAFSAGALASVEGLASGVPGPLGGRATSALVGALSPAQDAVTSALTSRVGGAVASTLGLISTDLRVYEYRGCYFTDLGRQLDSKGDRVVSVEATLVWLTRTRVQ